MLHTVSMFTRKPIARLWRRNDTSCVTYYDVTGWWLVLDRDGEIVRALSMTGPIDVIRTARQWWRLPDGAFLNDPEFT